MLAAAISSAVALVGVLTSVLLALRVSHSERRKLRHNTEKAFAVALNQKRLENYPRLFKLFSSSLKLVRYGNVTAGNVGDFRRDFERLDSEQSLFFSDETTKKVAAFHRYLVALSEADLAEKLSTGKGKRELIDNFEPIENSLKEDIGVYFFKEFRTGSKGT